MSAEIIKRESAYLAGSIDAELSGDSPKFEHDAELVLKFHGIYQQDDRDIRRERTVNGLGPDYSCMVRASVPGGVISAEQWLALDRVAGLANRKLRLTTRQGVQFHVVQKGELRKLVAGVNSSLLTTLGACGDVVRNVMACPMPHPERRAVLDPLVGDLVARFRPRTASYWELWIDGERAVSAEPFDRDPGVRRPAINQPINEPIDEVEPLYGDAYLPRKFKIGIAWPGDNCVDIYTHDVGIVPVFTGIGAPGVDVADRGDAAPGEMGELTGYVVLAGGGMGMSHQRPDDTYPLLAQPVGWAPPDEIGDVVEAIVATQRDHGNRGDRSRARLKYLLEERGVEWLRAQIELRTGRPLVEPVELPAWEVHAHHGWHAVAPEAGADDPTLALGLPVPSGTVGGDCRAVLRRFVADGVIDELRVTPRQDLLLCGISPSNLDMVETVLRAARVPMASDQSPTRNLAIACPSLPTCGKALGEAERILPEVVDRLEKLLADTGNAGLPLRLNMTGCPNGCSRPYAAELGIVGRTKKTYDVFLGGSAAGDRLARRVRPDVHVDDLSTVLRPLLEQFRRDIDPDDESGVSFGDWAAAQTGERLEQLLPPVPERRRRRRDRASARSDGQ